MSLGTQMQIFALLSPKDILNLTTTNKLFRDTLLSRAATTIWKSARERCEVPECPNDMTESRWAALLFGNSCEVRELLARASWTTYQLLLWQICNARNVQKVDFLLRRRVCTACKKQQ